MLSPSLVIFFISITTLHVFVVTMNTRFGHAGSGLMDLYAGTPHLRQAIDAASADATATANDVAKQFATDAEEFRRARRSFLLYE